MSNLLLKFRFILNFLKTEYNFIFEIKLLLPTLQTFVFFLKENSILKIFFK